MIHVRVIIMATSGNGIPVEYYWNISAIHYCTKDEVLDFTGFPSVSMFMTDTISCNLPAQFIQVHGANSMIVIVFIWEAPTHLVPTHQIIPLCFITCI